MQLTSADTLVLILYLLGVAVLGSSFVKRNKGSRDFMAAGGSLAGWAVGLSLFGTFLSSATFLGVPGGVYKQDWTFIGFCFGLPIAAIIGAKFFVPFYRRTGHISAYVHLESRFAPWARNYAMVVFLLSEIARIGSVAFGVSMAMSLLTGWDIRTLILVVGIAVTIYTTLGGMEAVIWTDVVQSVVLSGGALFVVGLLLLGPGETSSSELFTHAVENQKFSWGIMDPMVFDQSTFWMTLFYGLLLGLNRFGINQSYVQRYHTTRDDKEAKNSLIFGAFIYVPAAVVFCLIGSLLWSYHDLSPEVKADVYEHSARQILQEDGQLSGVSEAEQSKLIEAKAATLTTGDVSDKAFPHFIANHLPLGFAGLLLAALFAAGMSTIDTGLNCCASIYFEDIHKRYINPNCDEKEAMKVLHRMTVVVGVIGTLAALSMVGVKDLLDTVWVIESVSFGATLGLFLLGFFVPKASSKSAAIGTTLGMVAITWMVFSLDKTISVLPGFLILPDHLRCPLHQNLLLLVGTLVMFGTGWLASFVYPEQQNPNEQT